MKPLFCLFLIVFSSAYDAHSQNRFDSIEIKTIPLYDHIYMLEGAGGNIGICIGEDGVFIIDDQFAALSEKILDAIKLLSDKPLKYLINTHYHGDHSGGNENMNKAGATIVAHHNVKKRLEAKKADGSYNSKAALPTLTFNDKLNFYINNENIAVFHTANAHTDGDALLYFVQSNVLHTGDTYFNGRYPYIDINSGGSVSGYIKAMKRGLMIIDDETKIIPGHGKVSNKKEYEAFLNMLVQLSNRVQNAIDAGQTEEDVKTDKNITKDYDELGYGDGFINSERMRITLYKSLIKDKD